MSIRPAPVDCDGDVLPTIVSSTTHGNARCAQRGERDRYAEAGYRRLPFQFQWRAIAGEFQRRTGSITVITTPTGGGLAWQRDGAVVLAAKRPLSSGCGGARDLFVAPCAGARGSRPPANRPRALKAACPVASCTPQFRHPDRDERRIISPPITGVAVAHAASLGGPLGVHVSAHDAVRVAAAAALAAASSEAGAHKSGVMPTLISGSAQ